jgi:hypothetical protein
MLSDELKAVWKEGTHRPLKALSQHLPQLGENGKPNSG